MEHRSFVTKIRPRHRGFSRRTTLVWLSFALAMAVVIGLLRLGDDGLQGGYLVATNVQSMGDGGSDPLFDLDAPLDRERWTGIVIHHLGMAAGDAERVHRLHLNYGYQGLGYHFLIGNGRGLGDGIVHVGYRWNEQQPGAHVAAVASDSAMHNERSVGICLIGNGDHRAFTARQMRSLVALVRRLQEELDIPADAVHLHRDLAPTVSSPGKYFAAATFEELLRD